MKTALVAFPERYALPGRPTAGSASLDAYKQTQFLLADDLALFERAMNIQLEIVAGNRRARSPAAAAMFALWSRAFSNLADACMLMTAGSYLSCPPLLRTALDSIAVQRSLIAGGFSEYEEWLERAITQAKEQQALAVDLGRYRAGSVLAEDQRLGAVYRLLTDLSMPHFGSTALLVGPDSNLDRLSLAFADAAFHLGWAELISGWLLILADAQLQTVSSQDTLTIEATMRERIEILRREITLRMENPRRCRAEPMGERFLFLNFRRTASGQPRRLVL